MSGVSEYQKFIFFKVICFFGNLSLNNRFEAKHLHLIHVLALENKMKFISSIVKTVSSSPARLFTVYLAKDH